MKQLVTREVRSEGFEEFESVEFSAEMTGKFFDIVLDKLYTNKPESITRELWTNAFDAHVARGNVDRPFECKLPTPLDAEFAVRDYGCSMDDDMVMNLYTKVFASTKTEGEDANDFVGALGLGSKSFFSYTDAAYITVWLDGEKREYLATRGADGIPRLTKLSTEASDEEQGVRVSFPVQAGDFARFREAARRVAVGFDVKPDVPGLQFEDAPDPIISGDNWVVLAGRTNSIRQGCVLYPVYDLETTTNLRHGNGLIVTVPIGTANVAANREALSMDPVTSANINAAFKKAADEMAEMVLAEITDAPDEFTANQRLLNLNAAFDFGAVKYRGQKLDGYIKFKRRDKKASPQVISEAVTRRALSGDFHVHVNRARELRFLIDRGAKMPRKVARIRQWRDTFWGAQKQNLYILTDPTPQQLARLVKRLHLTKEQLIQIETLPDVAIERRAHSGSSRLGGVYRIDDGTNKSPSAFPSKYYYFEVKSIAAANYDLGELGYPARQNAHRLIKTLAEIAGVKVPVYAMTAGAIKRWNPRPTDDFLTFIKDWAKTNLADQLEAIKIQMAVTQLGYGRYGMSTKVIDALMEDHHPQASTVRPGAVRDILLKLDRPAVLAAEAEGKLIAEKVKGQFPMIFNENDQTLLTYIDNVR